MEAATMAIQSKRGWYVDDQVQWMYSDILSFVIQEGSYRFTFIQRFQV